MAKGFGAEFLSEEARKQFGIKENPATQKLDVQKDTSVLGEAGQTGVLPAEAGELPLVESLPTTHREIVGDARRQLDLEQEESIKRGREKLKKMFPNYGMQEAHDLRVLAENKSTDPDVRLAIIKDEEDIQAFIKEQNKNQALLVEGRKKLKELYEREGAGNMNLLSKDFSKIDPALDMAIKEQRDEFLKVRKELNKRDLEGRQDVEFGKVNVAELRAAAAKRGLVVEQPSKQQSVDDKPEPVGVLGKLKKFFLG